MSRVVLVGMSEYRSIVEDAIEFVGVENCPLMILGNSESLPSGAGAGYRPDTRMIAFQASHEHDMGETRLIDMSYVIAHELTHARQHEQDKLPKSIPPVSGPLDYYRLPHEEEATRMGLAFTMGRIEPIHLSGAEQRGYLTGTITYPTHRQAAAIMHLAWPQWHQNGVTWDAVGFDPDDVWGGIVAGHMAKMKDSMPPMPENLKRLLEESGDDAPEPIKALKRLARKLGFITP